MKPRISYRHRRNAVLRRPIPTAGAPMSYLQWSGQKPTKPATVPRQPKGGEA